MFTATYKKKDDGMRCVHIYKDGRDYAHREFASKEIAKWYAKRYDRNYKKV